MFPFWDLAIAPVLRAADAKRVVEIGALRGETTTLLLELLGPDAQLHVIDPEPQFDPAEHERRFGGRYVFHRDTSHAVLPELGAVDVALIDGDHNWYTVHRELELLSAGAREAGEMLPVLLMHDVCWPYGRRDLYYVPERIPEEHRQPYERRGMRPGEPELLPEGGINPTLDNAVAEGGPQNGVMTALEDFMAAHERPLRRIVLPIYFGLAVVAEEERLAAEPQLSAAFDRLESAECRYELLELAESLRLGSVLAEHTAVYGTRAQLQRGARRYLELLKGSLLDEHNIENEARLGYLASCQQDGIAPNPLELRDPAFHLQGRMKRLALTRKSGSFPGDAPGSPFFPYAAMGRDRLDQLEGCLDRVLAAGVPGDLVECGVGRGGGAIFFRGYLEARELDDRRVWAADEYRNPAEAGHSTDEAANLVADVNMVRTGFDRFGLLDERVLFLQGPVAESVASAPIEQIALLRIDCERAGAPAEILDGLYDAISVGGFVVVDGCSTPELSAAVEAFRERRGIEEPLERIDERTVFWRKLRAAPGAAPAAGPARVPLAPPVPDKPCELSVIVVMYNMRREAERTLHSLSRAYQRGVEELDYEVIVVENGSAPEQKLGEAFVARFGPEFRYVDLADEATASPATAINRGIALARGEVLALMVDGAHLLTPGVLHYAMLGIRAHEPAVVATQQWYVGPGQQVETISEGYNQEVEDGLFAEIDWPIDGYRLFNIGHFIGGRDWLDGMWESNCVFVPRKLLEQAGCMDEGFSMPGGGFANLDLYERVTATPGVSLVSILGEGSFHQVHGGTTTNRSNKAEEAGLISSYREHYAELRGRPYRWTGKQVRYVGSIPHDALRTHPRRMGAQAFTETAHALASDELPSEPIPLPNELEAEFTDAYWRSFRWQATTWLGHEVAKCPADLLAYQEMIVDARPDWVIETPSEGGGRALFLASICELLGNGRVLSIDERDPAELPQHPRITYLTGNATDHEVAARVRETVGEPPNALLVFGLAERGRLLGAFGLYEPLVPPGSGVIFEDTIMNGHPIWPGMGPGPAEAVGRILRDHTDFAPDPRAARLAPTFNPGGYLRRLP